ncbi:zinc metalloproteinase nas-13-like [Planococcus citri]|uniref:zinc metalloproteinase nas-13-like n=1 Tax=Planococcus citri TaxID=170843 RepID=UPI0031F90644
MSQVGKVVLGMIRLCFFVIFISVQSVVVEQDHNQNSDNRTIFGYPHLQIKTGQEIVHHRVPRGVFREQEFRWPSPTIPYEIGSKMSDKRRRDLKRGIEILEEKTCLKFKQRSKTYIPNDYIIIEDYGRDSACNSMFAGRQGGGQYINIGGCEREFSIIHEIMHALGFAHEHQRMDRDKYIEVRYNNIIAGLERQFDKLDTDTMGIPYDIHSVMHYGSHHGSIGSRPAIVSKIPGKKLQKYNELNDCDVFKINKLFKCKGKRYEKKCKL